MRKPIIFSALLALFVCPTLASYAGSVDSTSQHGTMGASQGGTERYTEAGVSCATSASYSHAGMYVDLPPAVDETSHAQTTAARASYQEPTHTVQSQTNNYVWTK